MGYRISIFTLIRSVFLILLLYPILYELTYTHETIHERIYTYFGCKNVTITTSWTLEGSTMCDDRTMGETPREAFVLHSWTELIGYYLESVITWLVMLGALLSIKVEWVEPK